MAVNLLPPRAEALLEVNGARLGVGSAGIRKPDRKDLLVVEFAPGTRGAGVFTRNRFCAAPVTVARMHLAQEQEVRAVVVNTGNANAGTGERGLEDALATCREVGRLLGVEERQVLPFSTGVILEPLPMPRLLAELPACVDDLRSDHWLSAAEAIMTTDTTPKAASRRVRLGAGEVVITGIAKGAGMIHPDMATMLCFIATDAAIAQPALQAALSEAADRSFNSITVDGDTSTNDAFILAATGRAPSARIEQDGGKAYRGFRDAVTDLAEELARAIVRDGEGATKFITVNVEQGASHEECRRVAFAIAHSPLVKTAFYASDPNLGRILAAIGYAGIPDLDVGKVDLYLDEILVAHAGGRAAGYHEEDGKRVMQRSEIAVRVVLKRGTESARVWTCDLSHDYVTINAEYRS